jgi:glycosyltransferase involved in cell wall biosynthesis
VQNGSDKDVRKVFQHLEMPISLAKVEIAECKPGAARNHALQFARGEIIVFLDDDIECFQNIFKIAKELFLNTEIAAAGGPNYTPPQSSFWARASGYAYAARAVTGPTQSRYALNRRISSATEHDLILCNLFVRKSAISRLGFPKNFVSNEENYLLQQLASSGEKLVADPGLAVYHDRRPNFYGLWEQAMKYGTGRAQNILANPDSFSGKYFLPMAVALWLVACFIFPILWWGMAAYSLAVYLSIANRPAQKFDLAVIAAPVAALSIHLAYALGLIRGFSTWSWRKSGLQETY